MIEQTNELVRSFNASVKQGVLVECKALLSSVGRLPGLDGKAKMSKSLDNAIRLSAEPDEIRKAVNRMYTDPRHLRVEDAGQVEGNVVFSFLDAFEPDLQRLAELKHHYRRGGLADSTLKQLLDERLQALIEPIRLRRHRLAMDRGEVIAVLRRGTERAREKAARTVAEVKRAPGLAYDDF